MTSKTLKYKNNWEADEYYINGKRIKALKRVRIIDKEYPVKTHQVSVPYNDMGHEYNGISDHYFVTETVFGIKKEFDLNEIVGKQSVFPLIYTTE